MTVAINNIAPKVFINRPVTKAADEFEGKTPLNYV